jgi:flagellar FliL protein
MADEQQAEEGGKKKSPLIMIIVLVVVILLLVVGSIIGTLAVTGFFSEPEQESVEELLKKAEEEKAAAEGSAEAGAEGEPKLGPDGKPLPNVKETPGGPEKQIKSEPDVTKFESRYKEMSRPLIANVAASRKVMSVTVAIMTHYDDKVLTNMDKHEFALRSASLDVLRQVTEADIDKPTFRIELAEKIRLSMNSVLERYEDFGGIEQVLFTEFIIQ